MKTNPTDQLTALHELAKTWPGGVEGCEWWAERITQWSGGWAYRNREMWPQHALDLVTCEAERYLRAKDWNLVSPGMKHEREWELDPENTGYLPMIEALAYAQQHHKGA